MMRVTEMLEPVKHKRSKAGELLTEARVKAEAGLWGARRRTLCFPMGRLAPGRIMVTWAVSPQEQEELALQHLVAPA